MEMEAQVQELRTELAAIEQRTQVSSGHLFRVASIKRKILQCMDKGISISKQLGDRELMQEYSRRKNAFMVIFDNMKY